MSFFAELKRRNVFRVAAAYLLAAWVLLQVVDFILDMIDAPNWIMQVFFLGASAGFVGVLVFSWVYEVTPEGIKREKDIDRSRSVTVQTGRKLDRVIITFLALAVVVLLVDRFVSLEPGVNSGADRVAATEDVAGPEPGQALARSGEKVSSAESAPESAEQSVAVLPFVALSNGPDDEYFADGLTEEILNALAQLPELLVTARTSSFHFKGQDLSVQEIASQLGVRNIVEGSVRRSGERLRVTAQLIRASDGFHLWSENYDRTSGDSIAVQEDIAEQIATSLDVLMNEDRREAMRRAGLRDTEAFVALQKGRELYERAHGLEFYFDHLREANRQFEIVTARVPGYSMAYQLHTDLYVHMLLNSATGQNLEGVSDEELAAATDNMVRDYGLAVEHASAGDQRNDLEADQAIMTGNWRGMPARIERFLGQESCDDPNWVEFVILPFGYAERMIPRAKEFRACDPMYSSKWLSESRALMWAGDGAAAVEAALLGTEIAPGAWLTSQLIRSRVALGQFDLAQQEVNSRLTTEWEVAMHQTLIAASRGDRAEAEAQLRDFVSLPITSLFDEVIGSAWVGRRESANSLAAQVDAHPFGAVGLLTIINWCQCGAPWDLSATPNFAGRLKESGLPWPPVSPINFPLKDW